MSTLTEPAVFYPESDGMPVADNALQFRWMSLLMWNAEALLHRDRYALIAADHLIYPVRGNPSIRIAPDVYIAFGPEKWDRGNYRVWEEGDVFPQVIFEVFSPSNTQAEMQLKREFCARYGAEEFYIIYPEYPSRVEAWLRSGENFVRVADIDRFVSPRVGFRFVLEDGQLTVFGPNGREWKSPEVAFRELEDARAEKERTRAESEREFAQYERTRAEKEHKRAESESERANSESTRADNERELAQHERTRAERLAEKLRQLGIDPNAE